MFIGRLDYKKGADLLPRLIDAVGRADIQLDVIGGDVRERDLLPAHPRITRLGWVDNADIDAHIRAADAVLIPSRAEAMGLVALEAMRNGRAVLSSNRGALPELVVHGFNGFVFDPERPESLRGVLQDCDATALRAMGANARSVYEQTFQGDRAYRALDQVYARALQASAPLEAPLVASSGRTVPAQAAPAASPQHCDPVP